MVNCVHYVSEKKLLTKSTDFTNSSSTDIAIIFMPYFVGCLFWVDKEKRKGSNLSKKNSDLVLHFKAVPFLHLCKFEI
jgi:hypothetical protein